MGRKPKPSKPAPSLSPKVQVHPLHIPVKISFRLYESGNTYCLCEAEKDDIKHFMDSLRKLSSMTWQQVRDQGGRPGNKTGLAYTNYSDNSLSIERPANVSSDLEIGGFRAGSASRVFGVAIENVFHVIWFDPHHKICVS